MEFLCTQCGICCRKAGELGLMPSQGDGSCIHLNDDNQCDIYDDRPTICNVQKMYKHYKSLGITSSKKDYYILNNKICNEWMDEYDIPKELRIDISEYDGLYYKKI